MATNIAKLVADMGQAKRVMSDFAGHATAAIETVKKAMAALGVGISVHAFAEFVRGAIDAADHLNDLSKKTGIAVEELGGLGFAAKQAGSNLDSMADAAGKLNRSIAGASSGNKEQAEAFKVLGVNVKDASGNLKSADQVIVELANKFEGFADGPNKVALAVRLFGKAGADMIPILDEGGAKLLENVEYYKRYSGVTKDVAQRSDEFNDTMEKLHLLSGALGTKIASALLDPLQVLASRMLEAKENSQAFEKTAEALADVFKGLAIYANAFATSVQIGGQTIGGMSAMVSRIGAGDLKGAVSVFKEMSSDNAKALAEAKKFTDNMLRKPTAEEIQDRESGGITALRQGRLPQAPGLTDPTAAAKELKLYESAVRKLEDELGKLNGQTEQQKLAFELYGKNIVTADGQTVHLTGSLEGLSASHKKMLPLIAAEIDAKKTQQAVSESLIKVIEAQIAAQQALDASTNQFFTTNAAGIRDLRFETSLIGLNTVEREKAVALRKIENDYRSAVNAIPEGASMQAVTEQLAKLDKEREDSIAIMNTEIDVKNAKLALDPKVIQQIQFETSLIGLNTTEREQAIAVRALELTGIDKNTEKFKEYVAALKQSIAERDFAQTQQQAFVSMWQEIDRTGRDTFHSIFDHGDDAFKQLKASLKKNLIDVLYAMTAQRWMIQIVAGTAGTGTAQQIFGATATQNAMGGGGMGSLTNLLSLGKSTYELMSGNSVIGSLLGLGSTGAGVGAAGAAALSSGISQGLLFGSLPSAGVGVGTAGGALFGSLSGAGSAAIGGSAIGGGAVSLEALSLLPTAAGSSVVIGGGAAAGGAAIAGTAAAEGAAAAGIGSMAASAIPYIGWAIAIAGALGLFGGSKKIPARLLDSGGLGFTGTGEQFYSRGSQGAMDVASAISKGLQDAAKSLGATLPSYGIGYGSNTGGQSQNPNFSLSASVGTGTDYSNQRNVFAAGEGNGGYDKLEPELVALRSAQAMLAVLREADMPAYLKDFFDALKPVAQMSAEEVNNALAYAQQLKTAHDLLDQIAKIGGLKATADQLIEMFGNMQTAMPLLQSYFDNFFSESEKHAQALKQVNDAMAQLGISTIPATREEFRRLVEAQDVTTDAGKAMFQALIAIAPAFAAVTDAITDAATDQASALTDLVSSWGDVAKSLRDYADELSGRTPGVSSYASLRSAFNATAMSARMGDIEAAKQLRDAGEAYRDAALDTASSSTDYARDVALIRSGVNGAISTADQQVSIAQRQLDELRNMKADLAEIKANTQSAALGTARVARQVERWDGDGVPPERVE